jgi:ABC-type transport system substrate-binding protein
MKDSRIGESLWFIWDSPENNYSSSPIFYTEDHVDIDNEVVRRALASAIQREGIASSLGDGFFMIDNGETWQGYSGSLELGASGDLLSCDENGMSDDGELLSEHCPTTWVRILDF